MSIKIEIPSYWQSFTKNMEGVEVHGSTVAECLNHLVKQFPDTRELLFTENKKLLGNVAIYINGEDAYPDELAKPVKDGDKLYILYIIDGG